MSPSKPTKDIKVQVPRHNSQRLGPAVTAEVESLAHQQHTLVDVRQTAYDPTSALAQAIDSASEWNSLLMTARAERGPQWDIGTQQYARFHSAQVLQFTHNFHADSWWMSGQISTMIRLFFLNTRKRTVLKMTMTVQPTVSLFLLGIQVLQWVPLRLDEIPNFRHNKAITCSHPVTQDNLHHRGYPTPIWLPCPILSFMVAAVVTQVCLLLCEWADLVCPWKTWVAWVAWAWPLLMLGDE